ncbi:MAG: YqaA family protein [Hyphomicrobiaceae bacterium]
MIKGAYDWMMRMAEHRRAPEALCAVSFAESSFFPIPPDIMLVPMILADRRKAWLYATLCTIASVVGGVAGYAIGYLALDLAKPILANLGLVEKLATASAWFQEYGAALLILKGWTPFPYKVLTISAGAMHMNLAAFIGASIVARAMRFYLVAGLLYWFGEPIRAFIEKRLSLVTTVLVVLIVGGFVAIRFLI